MQEIETKESKYTGGEVLRFVVAYTGAEPSQWDHHLSFLKHLRRCGVPNAETLRRGPAAQYRHTDLFQLAVAMEMTDSGMTAASAARVVTSIWDAGLSEVPGLVRDAFKAGERQALLLVVSKTSFDGFNRSPTVIAWNFLAPIVPFDGKAINARIMWADEFRKSDFFEPDLKEPSPYGRQRCFVINLSRLVKSVDGLAANMNMLNVMRSPGPDDKPEGRYRR